MKRKTIFKIAGAFFAFTLLLNACNKSNNNNNQGSSDNQSSSEQPFIPLDPTDYYNEENFINSTKDVTSTKLVTYQAPSLLTTSSKVEVKVENKDLFVYETRVNDRRKFSWDTPSRKVPFVNFDFEGKVHVEITVLEDVEIKSAKISPLVYGINPVIKDKTIAFDLRYNDNYTVEYNDNSDTSIHIFANPLEADVMTKEEADADPKKIYVGPGVYNAGAFPLEDGSEIYLAGGSYVYGQFSGEDFNNIKIYGRGIISGEIYQRRSESEYKLPVVLRNCKNIEINDIAFIDPAGWAITLYKCENATLNNVKIITARQNGDGISVQSSKHVRVNKGFVRTWDDSLVVKNSDRGTTDDVIFDGVTVWTDLAQSMEVGYETYGATMNDITFQNITVVHNFHKALISMHNCDDAVITNVTYKNITLEDGHMLGDDRTDGENDFLIDFTIAYNIDWTKSEGERGSIDGVLIENVNVYQMEDSIACRFHGESNNSMIKNVTIRGVKVAGVMKETLESLDALTNNYVEGLKVEKMDKVLGAYITLPYNEKSQGEALVEERERIEQEGMLVPEFSYQQGGLPYIGVKGNIETNVSATHGAGTKTNTPVDDGSGDYTKDGSALSSLTDGNEETVWESKDYKNEEDEFVGITMDMPTHSIVGKIRLKGAASNQYFYTYSIEIWARKNKTDGTMNDRYTRLSNCKDYEMTPASGNAIDINIAAQLYAGLQFRFFRNELASRSNKVTLAEIEFYPPALTYGKAIVDSSEHNDVYNVEKCVDGDPTGTSYYESKGFPAHIVIDLADVYTITTVVLCLPPSLNWAARTQKIAIYVSDDTNAYSASTTPFTCVKEETPYLFDPMAGNRVTIELDPVACRYFKLVISSNDIKGGYGAQLSEVSVYGA